MKAKIYKPTKTAMQSGTAKTKKWVLEYKPVTRRKPEPIMGWTSSQDTYHQVKLKFDSKDEAITYAKSKKLVYEVIEPNTPDIKQKSYAANFDFNRRQSWTH